MAENDKDSPQQKWIWLTIGGSLLASLGVLKAVIDVWEQLSTAGAKVGAVTLAQIWAWSGPVCLWVGVLAILYSLVIRGQNKLPVILGEQTARWLSDFKAEMEKWAKEEAEKAIVREKRLTDSAVGNKRELQAQVNEGLARIESRAAALEKKQETK